MKLSTEEKIDLILLALNFGNKIELSLRKKNTFLLNSIISFLNVSFFVILWLSLVRDAYIFCLNTKRSTELKLQKSRLHILFLEVI